MVNRLRATVEPYWQQKENSMIITVSWVRKLPSLSQSLVR